MDRVWEDLPGFLAICGGIMGIIIVASLVRLAIRGWKDRVIVAVNCVEVMIMTTVCLIFLFCVGHFNASYQESEYKYQAHLWEMRKKQAHLWEMRER